MAFLQEWKGLKWNELFGRFIRAHSLAWLERPADNREVKSPNLFGPTTLIWLDPQIAVLRANNGILILGELLHSFLHRCN
jgi:hypothetical protein